MNESMNASIHFKANFHSFNSSFEHYVSTIYLLYNIDLVSRDGRLDATLLKKSKVHFITAITSSKGNISHGNLRDILWFQDVE